MFIYYRDGSRFRIEESAWFVDRASVIGAFRRLADELEANPVARDEIGPYLVSTAFLGMDVEFGRDPIPSTFETAVFDEREPDRIVMVRHWPTEQAARHGHQAVAEACRKLAEED